MGDLVLEGLPQSPQFVVSCGACWAKGANPAPLMLISHVVMSQIASRAHWVSKVLPICVELAKDIIVLGGLHDPLRMVFEVRVFLW